MDCVPDPAKPDLPFFDDFEPAPVPPDLDPTENRQPAPAPPDLDPTENRQSCTLGVFQGYEDWGIRRGLTIDLFPWAKPPALK